MFVEYRNDVMDEKSIVCVTVQRGTARPYYLQGRRIRPEGVYVRQGASTVPAIDADFFQKRKVEFGKSQMRTLYLIGDDDMYINLAFLLSEQCTHMIKLAIFEGSKKTVFKDRRKLSGSLLEQLEQAFDYIERYNRTRAEFSGLDRVDMLLRLRFPILTSMQKNKKLQISLKRVELPVRKKEKNELILFWNCATVKGFLFAAM